MGREYFYLYFILFYFNWNLKKNVNTIITNLILIKKIIIVDQEIINKLNIFIYSRLYNFNLSTCSHFKCPVIIYRQFSISLQSSVCSFPLSSFHPSNQFFFSFLFFSKDTMLKPVYQSFFSHMFDYSYHLKVFTMFKILPL